MNRKLSANTGYKLGLIDSNTRFYIETIELNRLSALSFFEAGFSYEGERFYWQNAEKTQTIVGLGHAYVISNNEHESFESVQAEWDMLCNTIVMEDPEIQPILFGGFSFDRQNTLSSEWDEFPDAYFVVPAFQLVLKDDRAYVSINYITGADYSAQAFDELRAERDRLIHAAQVNEWKPFVKPEILSIEERKKQDYLDAVSSVTGLIRDGRADKVVIARSLKLTFAEKFNSSAALRSISMEQPESYHFGLELGSQMFCGATPERLVKVESGKALSTCLAGSIKRGKTAEEDRLLGDVLLNDPKNRGEHQYVVDMISSIFDEYCENYKLPKKPKLLKIRDIQHLYTPVEGRLKSNASLFQLVKSLHPTPALGGVPRGLSMEIIRKSEKMDRGYYAAPVGWIDASGNGEFAVAIRSALLDHDSAYLYAGGGIVADSEPISEYEETKVKFRPMLRTFGGKLNG
ncbi:isochorismate synthase MenF [Chungangia koreensis]|uniref:isochorismate synthase n=1 Tax=Chungangia koreensis TaxID=752657 RepID=A0ABV8X2Z8_9LACT